MHKSFKLIYLLLLLTLNFSCAEKKSSEKEISKLESEVVNPSKTDTLKFKSAIRAVFQDSKGNYWIGSHEEGVALFDGKSFTYFTTKEGLADNQIRSIKEDPTGTIWLGTANGVSNYDGVKITTPTPLDNGKAQRDWKKTENDLWFSAGNKTGVYRYDGQELNYLEFPAQKTDNYTNPYFVTGLTKGKEDMLWMATFGGVFGYNGIDFTIINDETLGLDIETAPLHIRSILEDSKGRLWIGNNGIGVLLKDGETIINFSENNNLIHPTSSRKGDKSEDGTLEHVFVIAEDGDGNIWFGDRDTGAWKFDGKTVLNYPIEDNLSKPMVWSIYNDKNNNLLFGLADGSVYSFNGNSFDLLF